MLAETIKKLRIKNGMKQKELAEKLCVTAQAVSRWENGDTEPSVSTIYEMANIFNVSVDELFGKESPQAKPVEEKTVEKEYIYKEAKPVLAVCEQCNKPIYGADEIVRYNLRSGKRTICRNCDNRNKKEAYERAVAHGVRQRKLSFIWGGIITVLVAALALIITVSLDLGAGISVGASFGSLLVFPFVSCLFLQNNFIMEMVESVASWGFVRFPGLIFSLDLEGIIWLLTVKLALWILGGIIAIAFLILAVVLGIVLGLFVYPFALSKNIKHPELSVDD
ncbi:MAG: helix-turn-helix transcriptional regulator [Clostridia bacterium]|nr:helix-turn-helix transcriptional regulator [Clostridia bacterium]